MGQKEHQYGHLYSAVWHYANSFTPTESPQTCSELLTTVVCLWRQNESQACVQCTRYCLRNENKCCPTRLYFELLVSHLILPYIFTQTKIVTNNSLTKESAPHNEAHWERDCEEAFHQIFLQRGTYLTKIVGYYIFNYSVVLQSINAFSLHGNNDDFALFEIILLVTVY